MIRCQPIETCGRDRPAKQGRRRRSNRPGTSQAEGPQVDGTLESSRPGLKLGRLTEGVRRLGLEEPGAQSLRFRDRGGSVSRRRAPTSSLTSARAWRVRPSASRSASRTSFWARDSALWTRLRATDPGHVEGNPVFMYHAAFNPDREQVADLEGRYRRGAVGDVEVKEKLAAALNAFLDPIRPFRRRNCAPR